jgi:TM2 domain-containing membrane protein YozV
MTTIQQITASPVLRLARAAQAARATLAELRSGEVKKPSVVLLASLFVPGLGSIINGDTGKGLGILTGFLVSALLAVVLVGIVGMFAFWLWGLIDAYDGATDWDESYAV